MSVFVEFFSAKVVGATSSEGFLVNREIDLLKLES